MEYGHPLDLHYQIIDAVHLMGLASMLRARLIL